MGRGFGGGGWGGRNWELREQAKGERFDLAIVRRALGAFAPYRWQAAGVTLLMLLIAVLGILPPLLTKQIIDRGIMHHHLRFIIKTTVEVIAITLASGLLGVWQNWISNVIGQNVMADFRLELFRHLHRQPLQFFTQTKSGELVSRVTNDVGGIQSVVTTTLVNLVTSLFTIGTTLAVMFSLNWQLSVLSLLVVPAFVAPTQRVGQTRQDLQRRIQQALARMTAQLTETLGVSGAILVKAFARERDEAERFSQVNVELRDLQVRQSLVGRWLFMWLGMFSAIGPALLWGYGGWLVIKGAMEIGTIVAFTSYLARLYNPLSQLAQLHVNVLTSVALFRRIYALLDRKPEIRDGPVVLLPDRVRGAITFEGVSFAYPRVQAVGAAATTAAQPEPPRAGKGTATAPAEDAGRVSGAPALRDVSIAIPPGSLTALVGPSGAGKTTTLNMVPRFYDPDAGRVTLDGCDLREFTLESLRAQIGLVPQEPFLFHDTVLANILYAKPDATRAQVEAACRAAQIHDVIAAMPQGYETVVGERGYRLSGGEKQRLAIARVLLRAPRIVLLDEATSSLDTLAERRIQAALETLLEGRTALVIAHRLSTVLAADQIVVMEAGRVVATGTHAQLLAAGGLYERLYREQFAVPPARAEPLAAAGAPLAQADLEEEDEGEDLEVAAAAPGLEVGAPRDALGGLIAEPGARSGRGGGRARGQGGGRRQCPPPGV